MNGWIKLHRAITEHEIFFDSNAFRVFTWLLTNVDRKTGKMTIARFWTSEVLRLNPNTFKDVIKRLEKKYKVITTKSTNKMTEISVLNWAKYQFTEEATPAPTPLQTPTKHQQNTNKTPLIQEVKNIRIKNKEERVENSLSYLTNIPDVDVEYFVQTWDLTKSQLHKKAEQLVNYCEMHNRKYKNYKAFLRNAISGDFKARPMSQPSTEYEYDSKGIARIKEMKTKLMTKTMEDPKMDYFAINDRRNELSKQAESLN
jgi:uncharacterized protein with von Willebrand factor type A (vWA) domain